MKVAPKQNGNGPIALTSEWFVKPGCEAEALSAVSALAATVQETEPGTLMYRVHTPYAGSDLSSLPPGSATCLLFIEEYADVAAFQAHVNGAAFTRFVEQYGHLFVQSGDHPFTTVQFVVPQVGFIRSSTGTLVGLLEPFEESR